MGETIDPNAIKAALMVSLLSAASLIFLAKTAFIRGSHLSHVASCYDLKIVTRAIL